MIFLIGLAVVLFIGAMFVVVDALTIAARQRKASIARATSYSEAVELAPPGPASFGDRAVSPVVRELARLVERITPTSAVASLDSRLVTAGVAHRLSPSTFFALKGAAGIGGFALGAFIGSSSTGGIRTLVLAVGFGAGFFILPDRMLAGRTRKRKEQIEADLPDALDLVAVAVEAGLSLDGAFGEIVENTEGPLADELAQTLSEIRVGENRQDALRALATRVDLPSVTVLTRAIIQSDQLGVSLGRILRIQARDTRLRRQASAEERAQKMPVKMLFPMLIFIFPALFVVVLAPALITLYRVI